MLESESEKKMAAVEGPIFAAKKAFDAVKEENERITQDAMKSALSPLPKYDEVVKYQEELKSVVLSTVEIEIAMEEGNVLSSKVLRTGLQQMVEICVTLVSLFRIFRKCFFSHQILGITKAVQLLMSK